jgi:hypothetical protein
LAYSFINNPLWVRKEAMKITPEHLEILKARVAHHDTPERRSVAIKANHSDKRYRWDLTYVDNSNEEKSATRFICDVLYKYANDVHIDTALRQIVPPLQVKVAPERAKETEAQQ